MITAQQALAILYSEINAKERSYWRVELWRNDNGNEYCVLRPNRKAEDVKARVDLFARKFRLNQLPEGHYFFIGKQYVLDKGDRVDFEYKYIVENAEVLDDRPAMVPKQHSPLVSDMNTISMEDHIELVRECEAAKSHNVVLEAKIKFLEEQLARYQESGQQGLNDPWLTFAENAMPSVLPLVDRVLSIWELSVNSSAPAPALQDRGTRASKSAPVYTVDQAVELATRLDAEGREKDFDMFLDYLEQKQPRVYLEACQRLVDAGIIEIEDDKEDQGHDQSGN